MMKIDPALVVPDESLSLAKGAISVSGWQSANKESIAGMYFTALAEKYGFSLETPFAELPHAAKQAILY